MTSSPLERLARTAYEAHRGVSPESVPAWEDADEQELEAWRAAVSAVTAQAGKTISEATHTRSLVIQTGDKRETFDTDFTVGRQGKLVIDDGFASGQHARFRLIRGMDGPAPDFLSVHELAGPEVLEDPRYRAAISTPWRDRVVASALRRERRVFGLRNTIGA